MANLEYTDIESGIKDFLADNDKKFKIYKDSYMFIRKSRKLRPEDCIPVWLSSFSAPSYSPSESMPYVSPDELKQLI